ncbi:MAG: ABC transporter permease [Anaerolineaceae bacterium]|nr:ABC transporter permease [Anaerolineaceae bacterium]
MPQPAEQRWSRWIPWSVLALIVVLALIFRGPLFEQLGGASWNIWLGAVAQGLGFGAVAIGVYLTFRILDFPDLTIDGSFPLGAAIASAMIIAGWSAYLSLPAAFMGGALAGVATGVIHTRLNINGLLASILVLTGAFTINLRIMGQSNIPLLEAETIFSPFKPFFRDLLIEQWDRAWLRVHTNVLSIVIFLALIVLVKLAIDWFLHTEIGLAMRATGDNPQMIRALGVNTDSMKILGLAISNGLVGLSGALLAQYQGFADVNAGAGLIIAGLAAVIIGETLFRPKSIAWATFAVVVGMIVYRLAIALALVIEIPLPGPADSFKLEPTDVKLATALLVLAALAIPQIQRQRRQRRQRG